MNCAVWPSSPNICMTVFICRRCPSNVKVQRFAWDIKEFSAYFERLVLKKWQSFCVSSISGLIKRSANWQLKSWNYFEQTRHEFKVFYSSVRSAVGRTAACTDSYKGGESLFSLLCIIPVMFLVSGGCDLLKSDILDACYSQVKKSEGRGGNLIILKRTPVGLWSNRAEISKAIS
jgi:hypothetical protein